MNDEDFEDEDFEDEDDDEWEWEELEEPLNVQQQPRGAAQAGMCPNLCRATFLHPVPSPFEQGAKRIGGICGENRERTQHAAENCGAGTCGTCVCVCVHAAGAPPAGDGGPGDFSSAVFQAMAFADDDEDEDELEEEEERAQGGGGGVAAAAVDYSGMNVKELKAAAKERGLKGFSTLKKAELLRLLQG